MASTPGDSELELNESHQLGSQDLRPLPETLEDDSGFESDVDDWTTYDRGDYPEEYIAGRWYQTFKPEQYPFPHDEPEQDRMQLAHCIFIKKANLFTPKITDPQIIVDLGCGTCVWANEMADSFEYSIVHCLDLSAPDRDTPRNVICTVADMMKPWPELNGLVDYVHARELRYGMKSWPDLCKISYDYLKPGGWFEIREFGAALKLRNRPTIPTVVQRFNKCCEESLQEIGVCYDPAPALRQFMEGARFTNVKVEIFEVPVGHTNVDDEEMKLLNETALDYMKLTIRSYTQSRLFIGMEERTLMELLRMGVAKELNDQDNHWFLEAYVVYGQKPPT